MTKTKAEIVAEAHRRIQVLSVDTDPSDDMVTYGESAADSLFAEVNADPYNMGFTWTLDTTPEAAFRPFAWLLAVDLASHYVVPPRDTRSRAMQRLAAYAFPDDREDSRDLDEDGTISDYEADVAKASAYY